MIICWTICSGALLWSGAHAARGRNTVYDVNDENERKEVLDVLSFATRNGRCAVLNSTFFPDILVSPP